MDQIVGLSSSLLNAGLSTAVWTLKPVLSFVSKGSQSSSLEASQGYQIMLRDNQVFQLAPSMRKWIIIAGLMGATAVALGAYGAHVVYPRKEISDKRKAVFETANKYHFLHSLALLSVPFARKPCVTGSLFLIGTLVFAGTNYYYAISDDDIVVRLTPWGGSALILAWLSLAL